MWILFLNDMRSPRIEILEPVCRALTGEALAGFLTRERVDDYRDGKWHKVFRQGGPLEWFNPPTGWSNFIEVYVEACDALLDQIGDIDDIGIDTSGTEVSPLALGSS